ncbi:alpha-glucuronidase family glycosyl hydrolase [Paenibacillus alkalitolerans]|uniref:alpha-glucuronidase family glycosyl hydrolase n=1 Tax=Paenibacillus alkalitolerans TaxID=2799335 RepID=UPI0018F502BE|nr:alpha-glucuronidase family glycosyl hydrolase [Paenibacillus alkalitolerans]
MSPHNNASRVKTGAADNGYEAWLRYGLLPEQIRDGYASWCSQLVIAERSVVMESVRKELVRGLSSMLGRKPRVSDKPGRNGTILAGTFECAQVAAFIGGTEIPEALPEDGFVIRTVDNGPKSRCIVLASPTDKGVLYAAFHLLRLIGTGQDLHALSVVERPRNRLRMINQWDNMDGSIERGYAGRSIFYRNGKFIRDKSRFRDYARMLASVGVNAIAINNVNVNNAETKLIAPELLPSVANVADIFRAYGIKVYLSINFASPIQIGALPTADPLDSGVRRWWAERAEDIYRRIPDFGGFLVKADSEFRPGPFTYGRNHADGANMLAEALEPFGGIVVWRCFVYNCQQDWRDRSTDRARAAYDHFTPLDGTFRDNVILQIKNGPMDFQVREPVSPLFGGLRRTNTLLELQITQEYTGQQRHLCYLVPQWKEIVDLDTYAAGEGTTVSKIVDGSVFGRPYGGFAAVSNIGDDANWCGHVLAQANLYGFGRLAWNPELATKQITDEWVKLAFGNDPEVAAAIGRMLLSSWEIYESYTAPLGVGWMVNPGHHYGPNVDGYEYSMWGTYHFADCHGIGVDRTVATGTGFAGQYHDIPAARYESLETCPDELLLFFHHVPYTHRLHSGKTVIQHIYDSHFEGVERVEELKRTWESLRSRIDEGRFTHVLGRLEEQVEHAKEWRDMINTYFYRKSGIPDERSRRIYS